MTIRAVLFDAAGVLTAPFSVELVGHALDAGADPHVLLDVLYPIFAHAGDGESAGNRLERGEITLEEFFASLGEHEQPHVRMVIDPASPTFFGDAWAPGLEMQAFVREVSEAGFMTAMVSNIVTEWIPVWERVVPLDLPFDHRVYSCVIGARKPEPAIYDHALDALGVGPSEALFLDDFEAMVDGARAMGMHAVHVEDPAAAIAEAREILGM
ncbi:MAG: HAD family phosphatase [Actinomycetota bacterium]